jgi:hypothetical protein
MYDLSPLSLFINSNYKKNERFLGKILFLWTKIQLLISLTLSS